MKQTVEKEPIDKQGWDQYWSQNQGKEDKRKLYNVIAEFYRRFIIRPSLYKFVRKYFKENSEVLHAGCGSGQVDADIRKYINITALDISKNALAINRSLNGNFCKYLHGSIFDIPVKKKFDGIYNLGVMEHFEESEIGQILQEFKRVLKDDGKLILFWPPEYGLSVLFFKLLKILVRPFLGPDIKFHPEEICRLKSREHGKILLQKNGFELIEYYFGLKDLFTYSILIAQKKRK